MYAPFSQFFCDTGKKPTKPDICNDMGQKHIYFEGLCEDNFTTSITIQTMDTLNALLFIAYISKT